MRITTLLYHDVVDAGQFQQSGFNGIGPNSYKLEYDNFVAHLDAANGQLSDNDESVQQLFLSPGMVEENINLITFDDGGVSFLTKIAPALEIRHITGVFFISTKYLGTTGFLNHEQLKSLHTRGHILGSHSHSHPRIFSNLTYKELLNEWQQSKEILENILGVEITSASVPGGYYSRAVAEAAGESGFKLLFTSEPSGKLLRQGNCFITGRYSIKQQDIPKKADNIINHNKIYFAREYMAWNTKKLVKNLLGKQYLKIRERLLR